MVGNIAVNVMALAAVLTHRCHHKRAFFGNLPHQMKMVGQMNGGYTWAWRPRGVRGKAAGVQNHFPVVQTFLQMWRLVSQQHDNC